MLYWVTYLCFDVLLCCLLPVDKRCNEVFSLCGLYYIYLIDNESIIRKSQAQAAAAESDRLYF